MRHILKLNDPYGSTKILREKLILVDSMFEKCRDEWFEINEIEAAEGDGPAHACTYVDRFTSDLTGIALSCERENSGLKEKLLILNECSLEKKPIVTEWISNNQKKYPKYMDYVNAIKDLHAATVKIIQDKINAGIE